MAKLQPHEQVMLEKVLAFAGNDKSKIYDGIVQALKGINNQHGRQYYWHLLKIEAAKRIRHAENTGQQDSRPQLILTP